MAIPNILQQIARSNPMLMNVKKMMSMVRAAKDPQAMISQMMSNNPQMQHVMEVIQKSGGDPMKAFEETAKKMGVNPDEIMDMLNG